MAEQVIFRVLSKLADPLIQECCFLQGVSGQLELVKLQLSSIQDFLKDASSKQKGDARVEGWVRNIRDMAFEIEDAIDIYHVEIHNISGKHVPLWKRCALKPAKLIAHYKLGTKISTIRAKIQTISDIKNTLGIKNLGEREDEAMLPPQKPVVPDIQNDEFVGFEVDKNHIIDALVNDSSTQRRRIISIVGPGGLGKTTLAKEVYNNSAIKQYFQFRVWLTISKEFKPIDVLKKLYEEVTYNKQNEVEDPQFYLSRLNNCLREKKYLVILDDVWSENVFEWLKDGLPDVGLGSRVIITTRSQDVAYLADPSSVFKPTFLSKEESLELLLKNALNIPDPVVNCPNELRDVAEKLADRCDGLPLAIVVLGRLLSKKPCDLAHWSQVEKNLDWYRDGERCMNILYSSYHDLPYYLKSCFRYLACFSEDHVIKVKPLLRMWIAEGFMDHNTAGTLEDEAKRCLEELAQRSLIQVVERDFDVSLMSFRVHDLILDLAIHESKENDYLLTYTKESALKDLNRARQAVLPPHYYELSKEFKSINMPNVRSFFHFDIDAQTRIKIKYPLLRVLELHGGDYSIKSINLAEKLKRMINLRCLTLVGIELYHLPETIGCLQNLQTLDIVFTHVKQIPNSFWEIQSLRHVVVSLFLGPPPSANLVNLQTLEGFHVPKSWNHGLPHLPGLRNLELRHHGESKNGNSLMPDWNVVVRFLGTLRNLVLLKITGDGIPTEIADIRTSPSYRHLQSLTLSGRFGKDHPFSPRFFLDNVELPQNLIKLALSFIWLDKDPMQKLGKLPCLKLLSLSHIENVGEIVCCAGDFPQLQKLDIYTWYDLKHWKVEDKSMPLLEKLVIRCYIVPVIPDLKHVKNLQELRLDNISYEFELSKLKDRTGEEWMKIQHVPNIQIN